MTPRPAGPAPEELGRLRWERLKQRWDVRAAAAAFVATFAALVLLLNLAHRPLHALVRATVLELTRENIDEDSGTTDSLVRAHLAGARTPGAGEVVLLGASYTASSFEPDPAQRVHRLLEERLERTLGRDWSCANLAHSGYDIWSSFYIARLLREERRPDVLVVSFDTFVHKARSLNLVLNTGPAIGRFSRSELSGVVPVQRQWLYRAEAPAVALARRLLPAFETLERARRVQEGIAPVLRSLARGAPTAWPDHLHPDGRRKSWRELPAARARLERIAAAGPLVERVDPRARQDLELLGRELARLQAAGTRVLALTLPKNPRIRWEFDEPSALLREWSARHGIEYREDWTSGLIGDEWFADTGHFFGPGCAVVADRIADWIESGEAR